MNLNSFEKQVSSEILSRGKNYYNQGNVSNLDQVDDDEWIAKVRGNSGNYTVEITTDKNGEINEYDCNCPYDGITCKHVVAVLYAIKNELTSPTKTPDKKSTSKKTSELKDFIMNIPEKELRKFVLKLAQKNSEIKNDLLVEFSTEISAFDTSDYINIIADALDNATDYHGFIAYRDVYKITGPLEDLLSKATEYIENGKLRAAFNIVSAVAPESIKIMQSIDDSGGGCGGIISDSFNMIDTILKRCGNTELSDQIFKWLGEQVENPQYDDYGCADDLEPLFFEWANTPERMQIAYDYIEKQISAMQKKSDWSSQYKTTKFLKYKIDLLKKDNKPELANSIIDANLNIADFREVRIKEAMQKKNYPIAIDLINDGIEQAIKDKLPGIVHNFKDQLLSIYQTNADIPNISKLSRELYFENRYSMDYYRIYKSTFDQNEWRTVCNKIIESFVNEKRNNVWGRTILSEHLANIYIEEGMWDQLFKDVKETNDILVVERYLKYIQVQYSSELIPIYKNAIRKYAGNTGRTVYETTAKYLSNLSKLDGGMNEAKQLAHELMETYKNRRAMCDVFKSIRW